MQSDPELAALTYSARQIYQTTTYVSCFKAEA